MLVDDLTVSGLLRVLREMQADKLTCDQINEISGEDLSTLVQNLSDISDKLSTIQSTIDQCETDASTFKTGIADAIKGVDSTATVTGDSSLPDFTSGIQNIVPNVTSDATATAGHILSGKTAYVNGSKVTGTISSKAAATYTPGTSNQTIAAGQYLSGAQTIVGDADLVAGNIKTGVNIFGVTGTFTSDATATAGHILSGKTAYVNGNKVTGTMNNYSGVETPRGATANITSVVKECNIDVGGYYGIVSFHPCFTGYIDANTVINQIVYGLNPNVIKAGQLIGAYGGSGDSAITGTFTSDATANSGDILSGKTAYVNGNKVTGSLPQLDGSVFGDHGSSTSFDNSPITWGGCNDYVGAFDYPLYGYFPNGTHRVHIPNLLPNNIKAGVKVGGKNGYITGTFTSDATAIASQILSGKTAYVNGNKITGTMLNAGHTDLYESINVDVDTSTTGEYASVGFPRSVAIGIRSGYYEYTPDGATFCPLGATPTIIIPQSDLADAIGLTSKLSSISKYVTILGKTGTMNAYGGGEYIDTPSVFTSNSYIVFRSPNTSAIFGGGSGLRTSMSSFGSASASSVLSGSTFTSSAGLKVAGTMNNYGGQTIAGDLTEADGSVVKFRVTTGGYCSGTTKISRPYSTVASALGITASKIAKGYTICGVAGTYTGAAYNCRTWTHDIPVGGSSTFTLLGGTKTLSSSAWTNAASSSYTSYYEAQINDLSGKINSSSFAICRVTAPTYGIRRTNGSGSYRYLKELVLFTNQYCASENDEQVAWAGSFSSSAITSAYAKRIRGYWLDSNRDNSSSSSSSHQYVEFYITEHGQVCVEFVASTANVLAFRGPLKFEFWVFYK